MWVDRDAMFEIISDVKEQRRRFAMVYADRDIELSKRYITESRMLKTLLRVFNGEKSLSKRHPVEQTARSRLDWTALVVDAFGAQSAIIHGSESAAGDALHAFTAVHGGAEREGINCEIASVDLSSLSANLLWSSSPRTAYAVISEVGRNYSVSLHDTLQEAASAVEQFEKDAADEYERSDASCCLSVVALPRIEFESAD